ncbi:hypothetical protein KORDIASMS9_03948 [Kordia sp. SMS9]|uniref:hypothetical protein n=1 Tax=Kordia sp. SMS9 TaxID=2282170 RepID=UPI000E0D341F|nr:hypothetical protein [Kordia sp. SMS9]AXG71691.1 hypothetical protein KORDIASMS9_03948 [Kordia sp. SMS9]
MKKNELTLDLKKVTLSKLNSIEEIKGGGSAWCGASAHMGATISRGYQPAGWDADTNQLWEPCDRES